MQAVAIITLSVLAAVVYGILRDQVTTRICLEYSTRGHLRLIDFESPTVLGLFWGAEATWWAGLPLGVGLAICARYGKRPKLSVPDLLQPVGRLLIGMFAMATLGGIVEFLTARAGVFQLVEAASVTLPILKTQVHAANLALPEPRS